MINKRNAKLFCCEDISLIENYYEAVNDKHKLGNYTIDLKVN